MYETPSGGKCGLYGDEPNIVRTTIPIFRQRLAAILKSLGMSQNKFAQHIGITSAATSQLLSGYRDPAVSTLIKINKKTGVSIDYLLGVEEPK